MLRDCGYADAPLMFLSESESRHGKNVGYDKGSVSRLRSGKNTLIRRVSCLVFLTDSTNTVILLKGLPKSARAHDLEASS